MGFYTIDDIKAQNPDMVLDLTETIFIDDNGDTISKFTSAQQNKAKYSGDGKYKYGYNNYTPSYEESVLLSKYRDINHDKIKNLQQKMFNDNGDLYKKSYDYYNSNELELNKFN